MDLDKFNFYIIEINNINYRISFNTYLSLDITDDQETIPIELKEEFLNITFNYIGGDRMCFYYNSLIGEIELYHDYDIHDNISLDQLYFIVYRLDIEIMDDIIFKKFPYLSRWAYELPK